ncbi:hypothetical protein ZIOFF_041041 [Zingiber officinale]|uniref:Plant heme peroxidase family profile domain-containing protein n=1 Tax=Zingiber officinale TaxID=94328 RepID=A0A8J5G723_ZINOF|nr:hypothetical protein ZIOFF_041041 [Zingiber officinale]
MIKMGKIDVPTGSSGEIRSNCMQLNGASDMLLIEVGAKRSYSCCDGSILLDNSYTIITEKDATPNNKSVRGFDVIDNIKDAVDNNCFGIVSCSDILAIAAEVSVINTGNLDPSLNTTYLSALQQSYPQGGNISVLNDLDVSTPDTFDNKYYTNLQSLRGLLQTDQDLLSAASNNASTAPIVNDFATNQTAFFESFLDVMIKMGKIGVLTGSSGEIRSNCMQVNGASDILLIEVGAKRSSSCCDGSILLDNSYTIITEKVATPNNKSVRGFDVIDNIKDAVDNNCFGIVSCSDILAITAEVSVINTGNLDPSLNTTYLSALQQSYPQGGNISVLNDLDVSTPDTFDNKYYTNLQSLRGLLQTDQDLLSAASNNASTAPIVNDFATNQTAFFESFLDVMIKMGKIGVLTGSSGEIRSNCMQVNGASDILLIEVGAKRSSSCCDGSILLDNSYTIITEKVATPNNKSVRGFDVIDNIKDAVDNNCFGIVSCSDILAITAEVSVINTGNLDPSLNTTYLSALQQSYPQGGNISVLNDLDVSTPDTFDNKYYTNLQSLRGLLQTDQDLLSAASNNASTAPIVNDFATNQTAFFESFLDVMIKMGKIGVLTGSSGEIRSNCMQVNGASDILLIEVGAKRSSSCRDGSILLDNSCTIITEKDAAPNNKSVWGFDVIDNIKVAVDNNCFGIVSCSDILAITAEVSVINTGNLDPSLNTTYLSALQQSYPQGGNISVLNDLDVSTPDTFDNKYYTNLQSLRGLLQTDQDLLSAASTNASTAPIVNDFAANQTAFFESFLDVMIKMGKIGVLTGSSGEIRSNCMQVNGASDILLIEVGAKRSSSCCDGSILLDNSCTIITEKDAAPNNKSVWGFDVIDNIKVAVDNNCFGIVSCSDILAITAEVSVINTGNLDPSLNTTYLSALQQSYPQGGNISVLNDLDVSTPDTFDNKYYTNLQSLRGLLQTDQDLLSAASTNASTAPIVNDFAANQTAFFESFLDVMIKMGKIGELTGSSWEIRSNCMQVNGASDILLIEVGAKRSSSCCDGSILLDNSCTIITEKDAAPNNKSVWGFDVIDNIKVAVDNNCFGIVSCSDILAITAEVSVMLSYPQGGNINVLNDLDVSTPDTFDNKYYTNLQSLRGLLQSDQDLLSAASINASIAPIVNDFAANQTAFFKSFLEVMIMMGKIGVLTGSSGEIRSNCMQMNAASDMLLIEVGAKRSSSVENI